MLNSICRLTCFHCICSHTQELYSAYVAPLHMQAFTHTHRALPFFFTTNVNLNVYNRIQVCQERKTDHLIDRLADRETNRRLKRDDTLFMCSIPKCFLPY